MNKNQRLQRKFATQQNQIQKRCQVEIKNYLNGRKSKLRIHGNKNNYMYVY